MRFALVVLAMLTAAAAVPAGIVTPPTVGAGAPVWLDAHTVGFEYQQTPSYDHRPFAVNDDGTGLRPVATLPDPAVSPDGRHRLSVDRTTFTLSVDGVEIVKLPTAYYGFSRYAWSPDSTRIAFVVNFDGPVYVVGADGRNLRKLYHGSAVTWLSNGELAVAADTAVHAVRDDGTHRRLLVTGVDPASGIAASPDGSQIAFGSFAGWGYDRGAALYVARTSGVDRDVRRVSPDVCTVQHATTTTRGACIDGTDVADRLVGTSRGDIVLAGAGDDVVHAGDGQNTIFGQWGNDTILSGGSYDTADGGGGSDVIRTGGGEDWIKPGPGRDVVFSGRGPDHVIANDGQRDVIDCGPGVDGVRADVIDVTRGCEHVTHP